MYHLKLLIVLLLCFRVISADAQTNISGGIYNDTTLTKLNSPYIVTGTLTVFQGVTLTIEPGTILLFKPNTQLVLRGKMNATGTSSDSIKFSCTDTTTKFRGIVVERNDKKHDYQLKMEYCIAEYATDFISVENYMPFGSLNFKHITFQHNSQVLVDRPGYLDTTIFDSCSFIDNNVCVYGGGWSSKAITISNCLVKDNKEGIYGGIIKNCIFLNNTKVAAELEVLIENCLFYNNAVAIYGRQYDGAKAINNEIIYNGIGIQIFTWQNGPQKNLKLQGNKICKNKTWNIQYLYNNNIQLDTNCFCSTDSALIRSTISDGYIDTKYGLLSFNYSRDTCSPSMPPPSISNPPTTILNNNNLQSDFTVYPNPASETISFKINSTITHAYSVSIMDITGRTIKAIPNSNQQSAINISELNPGLYFVVLTDKNVIIGMEKLSVQ